MATMESSGQQAPCTPEIPRFDDGTIGLQKLIRVMAESLVSEIVDFRAEGACADGNRRNSY